VGQRALAVSLRVRRRGVPERSRVAARGPDAMSYSTLNRFSEPLQCYAPPSKGGYIPGTWWPDFGPCSNEFSEQHKMHPTNTIFRTHFEETKERSDLLARPASELERERDNLTQFRRNPSTEALYKSTIIQPYKSGGHASSKRELANYQAAATREPPAIERERNAFGEHLTKTLSLPALTSTLPTSLVRLREGSGARISAIGAGAMSVRTQGGALPEWLAPNTIASRPPDAAGHAGTTRNAHCRTTAETGKAHSTLIGGSGALAAASMAGQPARSQRWQSLTNPHGP